MHKYRLYMFNVWTIIIQSLNIKEWKLLQLQITQARHPWAFQMEKMSKYNSPKNKEMFIKFAQKGEAHVQCINNYYAKIE